MPISIKVDATKASDGIIFELDEPSSPSWLAFWLSPVLADGDCDGEAMLLDVDDD